ncbi:type II CRISPR RNA-guided endonuclease Cas9 [Bizionia saleffrena]|uniref:CRISPR-associated endonuclease Cas9 n=1 Tax=Bizionia saleffrena TaxID=291189 RepID=A0A8H2LFD8_9FLAO|nr:type II CRISPR RNA-guided endonuclease Cas9 [Bizionia saleffrena]TYB80305.1 type II CRISPR RNA-guided endonuclease Cas9 [Bizionia saleffrena]
MAKILGLDLGTNSIGWAVVYDENNEIAGMGSRIFPEGVVAKTIGTGEKEESKNAARRNSRQQRRQFYRKRLRKIKLLRTLIDLNMCPLSHAELDIWAKWDKSKGKIGRIAPNSKSYIEWHIQNPYYLRNKALHKDLTLFEMGRVLYHIIQRRGFLSNRKGNDEGKIYKGKEGMVGIDQTQKSIVGSTLGSFLNSIYPVEGEPFKLITDENGNELRVRARYTLRDMYVEEFDKIWTIQAKQLGLLGKVGEKNKLTFLKGNLSSNRNKKKIEKLYKKYGEENVNIEEIKNGKSEKSTFKIVTKSILPLKEFFGGEIEYDEEGKVRYKSEDSLLFWQRPLRSQKGLLSKCRFEPTVEKGGVYLQKGKSPCHLSHPTYEEFRAYQYINNIEYGKKQKLNGIQRLIVLDLINCKDSNFDFSEIPKKLKMPYEKWNYSDDQKVPGNYTTKHLAGLFPKEIWENHKNKIWHCFYDFKDNDILVKKLISDFGLDEKLYDKVKKINLKEGYSNVSLKAVKNILPFLREGYRMSDATILGGVMNAFGNLISYFKDSEDVLVKDIIKIIRDKSNKEGEAIEKIKIYLVENKFGFVNDDKRFIKLYHHSQDIERKSLKEKLDPVENLRNPIVQQGINETRRLVNQLIKEHGQFDRIQVELGRNIKNSKKGRQEQSNRINENTVKNDAARELLTEYGLKHNRNNIQKVLLYKEMQDRGVVTVCPYTNTSINISDVLGAENKIQIEHIIPRSISLNDSFANKTLCDSKFNTLKGKLTPYQFYQKNNDPKLWGGAERWEDIEQRAYKLLPYYKAKCFTSKIKIEDSDVQSSFIERQLNDMRYISKKTKEIMSQVCDDVRVLPGSLTAELRHLWGLNNILQPVMDLDITNNNIKEDRVYPHYVVMDEDNKAVSTIVLYNKKPALKPRETTITGIINKDVFKTIDDYVNLTYDTRALNNGKYWLKLKLSQPTKMVRIFKERPESTEKELVLRGKIDREKFKNNSVGMINAKNFDNGSYWAKLAIKDKKFVLPEIEKQPKKLRNQVLLFGEVKDNYFTSFIYECETNKIDGKYWLLLDVDLDNANFNRAINEMPAFDLNQIRIEGTLNSEGVFVSEVDTDHRFKSKEKAGKYWVVFDIVEKPNEFNAIENPKPILEDNQTLIEGNIWVDKYTGEIKFDPKKNRGDHRHHAIDALVVALSKQSYFQQLSDYNAQREAKYKGLPYEKEQLNFPEPWTDFHTTAKNKAEKILVSHKQNRKVLTQVRKRIIKNGQTYTSVGDAVRGQLHKENIYGQRQAPFEISKGYHIRKKVSDLKDNQLKKIVDLEIRKIIVNARVEEVKMQKQITILLTQKKKSRTDEEELIIANQIESFQKDIQQLYTLKNKNGEPVPIKKVRVREEMSNAQKVKELNQYVNPRNNHHILIYKDENGELKECINSFWKVVERQKQKQPIYQLPNTYNKGRIINTLEENDMFLLGLTDEEYNDSKMNYDFLTKHLFRVQKISEGDYSFRHHLASTLENKKEQVRIGSLKKWKEMNPIKVKLTEIGSLI